MVVWLSAAICLLVKVVAVAGRRVPHQLLAAAAAVTSGLGRLFGTVVG